MLYQTVIQRNADVLKKTYELPLSKEYVRHWGMAEAVRELIQNALDSESPFEYEFTLDKLYIISRFASLTPKTLLLGSTSKSDNKDAIGSFGEGYKIALLVLTREGYPVKIHNGERTWVPGFVHSKKFDAEMLCIDDLPAVRKREGLVFEVQGLGASDIDAIKASCLHMQDSIGAVTTTSKGMILREQPGKLYVGGLYICDTKLAFGYDIKPEHIRLERDRQTVSTFDLQWLTKEMWFETERWDEIAELLEAKAPDLEHAEYGAPEMVKEACYRHFCRKNPGKVLVKDQAELQRLVEKGMKDVVYVSSSPVYSTMVRTSSLYRESVKPVIQPKEPAVVLDEWLAENRKHMRRSGIVAFKALVEKSAKWKAEVGHA